MITTASWLEKSHCFLQYNGILLGIWDAACLAAQPETKKQDDARRKITLIDQHFKELMEADEPVLDILQEAFVRLNQNFDPEKIPQLLEQLRLGNLSDVIQEIEVLTRDFERIRNVAFQAECHVT